MNGMAVVELTSQTYQKVVNRKFLQAQRSF